MHAALLLLLLPCCCSQRAPSQLPLLLTTCCSQRPSPPPPLMPYLLPHPGVLCVDPSHGARQAGIQLLPEVGLDVVVVVLNAG
jgi:hypothetical protein